MSSTVPQIRPSDVKEESKLNEVKREKETNRSGDGA